VCTCRYTATCKWSSITVDHRCSGCAVKLLFYLSNNYGVEFWELWVNLGDWSECRSGDRPGSCSEGRCGGLFWGLSCGSFRPVGCSRGVRGDRSGGCYEGRPEGCCALMFLSPLGGFGLSSMRTSHSCLSAVWGSSWGCSEVVLRELFWGLSCGSFRSGGVLAVFGGIGLVAVMGVVLKAVVH
jgi:hypothetical protein